MKILFWNGGNGSNSTNGSVKVNPPSKPINKPQATNVSGKNPKK